MCRAAGAYDPSRIKHSTEFDWTKHISARKQRKDAVLALSAQRSERALEDWRSGNDQQRRVMLAFSSAALPHPCWGVSNQRTAQ